MGKTNVRWCGGGLLVLMAGACFAQVTPDTPDLPARFAFPAAMFDYTVREEMIPLRDGIAIPPRHAQKPLFDSYLVEGAPKQTLSPVTAPRSTFFPC